MKSYLDPGEVKLLEEAATNRRDSLLIHLLFRLGCRISEALALTVEDIDFGQGRVTILHLKARMRLSCPGCDARLGRAHAFCPTCGAKVDKVVASEQRQRRIRTLPIGKETLDMLKDYIRRGGPVMKGGRHLIFGISRGQAWRVVRDCALAAGLPPLINPETGKPRGISPHRLRDAFAVHAVKVDDSGDGLRLLQEHLGHVSFNTTARYRKVSGHEHRRWYARLWRHTPTSTSVASSNTGDSTALT